MNSRNFEILSYLICIAFTIITGNPLWMIAAALFNIATLI